MSALVGDKPSDVFRQFREHIGRLLNVTITDARLSLVHSAERPYATITFRDEAEIATAAPLRGSRLFLYLSQDLLVEEEHKKIWKLRTMAYTYHILEAPAPDSRWIVRWEYISRDRRPMAHPRHHVHLPSIVETLDGDLDFSALHLSTGWVTVEEVIRFLIVEVGVVPKTEEWDKELQASEEKFREWTSRDI